MDAEPSAAAASAAAANAAAFLADGEYAADAAAVLATQHDNGGPLWSTPDGSLVKGGPFSTVEASLILREIGYPAASPELLGVAVLLFDAQRPDGRFKVYPSGAIYPCQTAGAARALGLLGYAADPRLEPTYAHLLSTQEPDGGWRCNASKFGKGPETAASNPGPTLTVLDVFRLAGRLDARLDAAVEFLLRHWVTKAPLGPCHYGIGSLFMKIEYPLFRYNLFHYLHTLSFYPAARRDGRFLEALDAFRAKLVDGQVAPESVNRKLAGLEFCRPGRPSAPATARYREILRNLEA
jgi:hypothetical protein